MSTFLAVAALIVFLSSVLLAILALPREPFGCPACRYPVNLDIPQCPECGRAYDDAARISSRRRKRRALTSLACVPLSILLALAAFATPAYPRWLPGAVLVHMGSCTYKPRDPVSGEVIRRRMARRLSDDSYSVYVRRLLDSNPVPVTVQTRAAWPAGAEPRCIITLAAGPFVGDVIRVETMDGTLVVEFDAHLRPPWTRSPEPWRDPTIPLPGLRLGDVDLPLRVIVLSSGEQVELGRKDFVVATSMPSIDEGQMNPVDFDLTSRFTIGTNLIHDARPSPVVFVRLTDQGANDEELADIAIAGRMIVEDLSGREFASIEFVYDPSHGLQGATWHEVPIGSDLITQQLRLRIVSDPNLALQDFGKTKYWSGEAVVGILNPLNRLRQP